MPFQVPAELPPEIGVSPLDIDQIVVGSPGNQDRIGLVLKRTFVVTGEGRCELAEREKQEIVLPLPVRYERLAAPLVSPLAFDVDTRAFRDKTDLVVQASAQSYGTPLPETRVAVQLGDFRREIRVHGDRRVERRPDGTLRFSSPEPFEEMPIVYDLAYGGFDAVALEQRVSPAFEELKQARPELELDAATPFHYARNPAGVGFLIEAAEENLERVSVPNLDYPDDPITPERLAVGVPERWVEGPLPAGLDWFATDWFPRCAYIGAADLPHDYRGAIAEIERGWAAPDLLSIPSLLQAPELPVRPEFAQAASPGMSFEALQPGLPIQLTNLHPGHPSWTLRLPAEVPQVDLEIDPGMPTRLETHLNSVVVRPDLDEVVMTWCAHAPVGRRHSPAQYREMRRQVHWLAGS